MMIIGYISFGLSVLITMCVISYRLGYDAGHAKATKTVRVWFKDYNYKS